MRIKYKTIGDAASAEINIEKSKFLSHIKHVKDRAEAESYISEIKTRFSDATHNVSAFILGEKMELKWATDDGEPQGTAGMPILRVLEENELTNTIVIVTRYFGGKKLGTGGLVRAYTESALEAIKKTDICHVCSISHVKVEVDYSVYNKVSGYQFPFYVEINQAEFLANVILDIDYDPEKKGELKEIFDNFSKGRASYEWGYCKDKAVAIPKK